MWTEIIGVVLTTILAFLFAASPLAQYDLQLIAIFFILYFFAKKFLWKKSGFFLFEALAFIFIIVITVFSTGGLQSPFFFLFYFLLFALALILEPITSLVLTIVLIIIFFASADYSMKLIDLLPLLSLPFIAPFAKYMGDLQKRSWNQKTELKRLGKAKDRVEHLKSYEKEQTLIFLTTALHRHLEDIQERIENWLGDEDLRYLKNKVKELEKVVEGFMNYIEKI